jgi:hypothetical protein
MGVGRMVPPECVDGLVVVGYLAQASSSSVQGGSSSASVQQWTSVLTLVASSYVWR